MSKASVDPSSAAHGAMELYDANGDGVLSDDELAACPAILNFKAEYDADGNGVSAEELESRLRRMYGPTAPGLVSVSCTILSRGRPLSGAEVRFVPEPFLGDSLKTGVGQTDQRGLAHVYVPDDQLPESERGLYAMRVGLYRVEIDHPSIKDKQKDKKYGWEVSGMTRGGESAVFDVGRN